MTLELIRIFIFVRCLKQHYLNTNGNTYFTIWVYNYEIFYTCYVAAINGYLSIAGSWTRLYRVRAEYPNQLDYNGCYFVMSLNLLSLAKQSEEHWSTMVLLSVLVRTCIKVCIEHTHICTEHWVRVFVIEFFCVFPLSHSLSLPRTVRNSKLPLNLRFLSFLFSVFILASAGHSFQ